MDRELRKLERLAATGDPEAMTRLEAMRERIHRPPPMTPTEEALSTYLGDQRMEDEVTLGWEYGLEYTINGFHFMSATLVYNDELQTQYDEWVENSAPADNYNITNMESFIAEEYPEAGGIYGEGEPFIVNTYNHENCLSEVLQYMFWSSEDDGDHVLVQIHLGGDVRGNYSQPVAFDLSENYELAFLDTSRGNIACNNDTCGETVEWTDPQGLDRSYFEPTRWYTDDCYHWYGEREQEQLETMTVVHLDEDISMETHQPDEQIIFVNDNWEAHCPICRSGTLYPVPYYS